MRPGSTYAVHNRGPPCKATQVLKGKATPCLPPFSQPNYEAVGTKS